MRRSSNTFAGRIVVQSAKTSEKSATSTVNVAPPARRSAVGNLSRGCQYLCTEDRLFNELHVTAVLRASHDGRLTDAQESLRVAAAGVLLDRYSVALTEEVSEPQLVVGDLYLGCGRAVDEAELWRKMLHRPVTRITYWPFALPAPLAYEARAWLRSNLDTFGANYELDVWQDLQQHRPEELTTLRTDLLFVGGGNTFQLLDAVQRGRFADAVKDFVSLGGDYYGGSAGAVLACESIAIAEGHDPNEVALSDLTGLGLLRGVAILPHFTHDQLDHARDWSHTHQVTVLGLPETSSLHCQGTTAEIIGTGLLLAIGVDAVQELTSGEHLHLVR